MSDLGFSSPIDLGLSQTPGPVENFEMMRSELEGIYNAIRILQQKMGDYAGVGVLDPTNYLTISPNAANSIQSHRLNALIVTSTEAIAAGDMVTLWDSGGIKVKRAQANAYATRAWGWAPAAIANGGTGIIYLIMGYQGGFAGLTVGAIYYLSIATPGGITAILPAGAGNILQEIGIALSATELFMCMSGRFAML